MHDSMNIEDCSCDECKLRRELMKGKTEQMRKYAEARGIEFVELPKPNFISYDEFITRWTVANEEQAEGRFNRK